MVQMNLTAKQRDKDVENKLTDIKVGRRGGMNLEIGIDMNTLLCIK